MLPLIKKRSHDLFVKLAFPSMIEVTTTNGNALSTFGLTSTCPLARMVFDEFVFKAQGSSSADPISPDDNSMLTPRHEYDTPNIREDLWVNHGIGTFTVKEIGRTRNTVTNICRDVVRKLFLRRFPAIPLAYTSCCIAWSHPLFAGDIFLSVDSSFGVFEDMVKADCHKDCALIPPTNDDPSPVNNDLPFLSLSDMIIPREKAEALLPILLVSCLRLNSSSSVVREHKSILAPIFAAAYFFNRAKILPFSIQSGRNKRGHMTPKAMSYLHGKLLMDLVTPCEEAFIRFVVLLDIMRYHPYSLEPLLEKYGILFSAQDKNAVLQFINTYTKHGVEKIQQYPYMYRRPFKGYRTKDILLFMIVKKQVLAERHILKNTASPDIDLPSPNPSTTGFIPFAFSFPESIAVIKLESDHNDSDKKRKLLQDVSSRRVSPSMAMEFDDGYFSSDDTNAAHIPFWGV
jgi:hypothetical protein